MLEAMDAMLGIEDLLFFENEMLSTEMDDILNEEIVETSISSSESSGSPAVSYSPSSGEEVRKVKKRNNNRKNECKKLPKKSMPSSVENMISKNEKPASPGDTYLPPCRVCEDRASGLHYGVNTCEACKGFFRRSIVKIQQNGDNYKCIGTGNCKLGPGKRNACAACRYDRCLEVGMSICAIKTGRYTYEKRTQDTVEVKKLQAKGGLESDVEISEAEADSILTKLNAVLLRGCPNQKLFYDDEYTLKHQEQIYLNHQAKIETFGSMSVIPKDVWDEFYKETGIDLDNRQELMRSSAVRMERGLTIMVDFVRALPGFTDLSVSDQTALIKASHFEFWFVAFHRALNPDLKVVSGMFGMHVDDIVKVLEKDYVDCLFQFSRTLKRLKLTLDETTLLRGVAVTFRDRCDLEEPDKVEKIQWKLLNCLRIIAKRNNLNPDKRLCQYLDRLTALRTVTEMNKEMDKQKSLWPVMKEHPLVLDVISS